MASQWRLELFFKSLNELRLQILPFLRDHQHIRSVNLTNKSKDDNLLEGVSILHQEVPNLDICVHYSIKYNYFRSAPATGLDFIEETTAAASTAAVLEIYGSVFIPSKRLQAQMKFRPRNGVFLSEEYLDSVEKAEAITTSPLKIFKNRGVIPLVETAVKTKEELQRVITLLDSEDEYCKS